jgi:hypothetical protein
MGFLKASSLRPLARHRVRAPERVRPSVVILLRYLFIRQPLFLKDLIIEFLVIVQLHLKRKAA